MDPTDTVEATGAVVEVAGTVVAAGQSSFWTAPEFWAVLVAVVALGFSVVTWWITFRARKAELAALVMHEWSALNEDAIAHAESDADFERRYKLLALCRDEFKLRDLERQLDGMSIRELHKYRAKISECRFAFWFMYLPSSRGVSPSESLHAIVRTATRGNEDATSSPTSGTP